MCGTSKDCAKICIWATPATCCLVLATMGFSMVGSCLFGMYFTNKAEDDFLPWKCEVTKTFEFRNEEYKLWIDAYPQYFDKADGITVEDGYLRREIFMTKTKNYTDDNMEYICYLYGYVRTDYSVEEEKTIIWDVEKMDSFFNVTVFCGMGLGLFGLFSFMFCWRIDNRGEYMHRKVKQIFFALIFATAMFIAGICGLVIDLFPYDGFAKSAGGLFLGISLCYPCYCFWAMCKVVKDVRLGSSSANQGGQIHRRSGENEMGTITYGGVSNEGRTYGGVSNEGHIGEY